MTLLFAVALIFVGGCLAGGVTVSLLFRNSRRVRSFISKRTNEREAAAAAVQLRLAGGPHFVAVGGGTGLSSLLKGLKGYTRNIVALVTVTDEGGSSGRLVRDWGMLPPGDIRNCLVALSENDDQLRAFMNFRFGQGDLKGHSLGNLILLAATEQSGDFKNAVELVNNLLAIRGRVLPITTENVTLVAETNDGATLRGELAVAERGRDIRSIRLEPSGVKPVREAFSVLHHADLVILGPGSLFTSVIPNLLVEDFTAALRKSKRPVVYVANLMTQPGETSGMTQLNHIQWVAKALGRYPDVVVLNEDVIPEPLREKYRAQGAEPLSLGRQDEEFLISRSCQVFRASLLQIQESGVVRHHSARLAEALMRINRKLNGGYEL
ncbi:gluconeogenesis factor YvcK family protein [Pyramidobacter sp. C12-8]|uniref:gluconeogenesis factor YvcK family protein n=1 Tax=Pyramidobacter sp. C12-8 TaxID=1943580 RepID=UPI00098EDCA2|nr:uridine diphosphate-N-acetylglucosamine-binding protein YvcK [Pyramidobacter sp. C12-8]OON89676.1 hypothetical protein B0D78_02250 [Pyramidobacter sp. C12-8]